MENKKQFGIMLYTKADYTSQTDPVTGWRKKIYLKKGSEDYIKKQIEDNFDKIGFDGKDYYFEYTIDYLEPVKKKSSFKKKWRLYSGKNGVELDRFFREKIGKEKWNSKKQEIIKTLDKLFDNFRKDDFILEQIKQGVKLAKVNERTAWETLRFIINLIQQIRNTGTSGNDEDFILSPVRDKNGNHFDSRKEHRNNWPTSGDANGAYNIAKKGIIMTEHIKKGLSPFIRDDEWDAWLAGEKIWNKWLEENEKYLSNKWNPQSKSQK
jgi:CRISPR-associated protein Cpf1